MALLVFKEIVFKINGLEPAADEIAPRSICYSSGNDNEELALLSVC